MGTLLQTLKLNEEIQNWTEALLNDTHFNKRNFDKQLPNFSRKPIQNSFLKKAQRGVRKRQQVMIVNGVVYPAWTRFAGIGRMQHCKSPNFFDILACVDFNHDSINNKIKETLL